MMLASILQIKQTLTLCSQMKDLSIKEVVAFRKKSDRGKKNFATNLQIDKKESDEEGGGDYWISCLSAISNSYRSDNLAHIVNKIAALGEKHEETDNTGAKAMYKINIDILRNYEEFDLKKWKPSGKLTFIRKIKENFILTIKGFKIKITPQYVFTYTIDERKFIGAIWFISKLNGFRKEELGMFTEILFRYLNLYFSKDYQLDSKYCIAVDVFNSFEVNYSQLESKEISAILNPTLDEIKKLIP